MLVPQSGKFRCPVANSLFRLLATRTLEQVLQVRRHFSLCSAYVCIDTPTGAYGSGAYGSMVVAQPKTPPPSPSTSLFMCMSVVDWLHHMHKCTTSTIEPMYAIMHIRTYTYNIYRQYISRKESHQLCICSTQGMHSSGCIHWCILVCIVFMHMF